MKFLRWLRKYRLPVWVFQLCRVNLGRAWHFFQMSLKTRHAFIGTGNRYFCSCPDTAIDLLSRSKSLIEHWFIFCLFDFIFLCLPWIWKQNKTKNNPHPHQAWVCHILAVCEVACTNQSQSPHRINSIPAEPGYDMWTSGNSQN